MVPCNRACGYAGIYICGCGCVCEWVYVSPYIYELAEGFFFERRYETSLSRKKKKRRIKTVKFHIHSFQTHTHTYIHTYTHTYIHTHTHTHKHNHSLTHSNTHTLPLPLSYSIDMTLFFLTAFSLSSCAFHLFADPREQLNATSVSIPGREGLYHPACWTEIVVFCPIHELLLLFFFLSSFFIYSFAIPIPFTSVHAYIVSICSSSLIDPVTPGYA